MKTKLTRKEKEIERDLLSGELKSAPRSVREAVVKGARRRMEAARKEARVNIRLAPQVLEQIKEAAAREGIPYQTYMASVLHKVVTGQFVSRQQWQEVLERLSSKKAS